MTSTHCSCNHLTAFSSRREVVIAKLNTKLIDDFFRWDILTYTENDLLYYQLQCYLVTWYHRMMSCYCCVFVEVLLLCACWDAIAVRLLRCYCCAFVEVLFLWVCWAIISGCLLEVLQNVECLSVPYGTLACIWCILSSLFCWQLIYNFQSAIFFCFTLTSSNL